MAPSADTHQSIPRFAMSSVTPPLKSNAAEGSTPPFGVVLPGMPGGDDKNVAVAWTAWMLREDDSPTSVMDAIMNGLAAGVFCGGIGDLTAGMLRRLRGESALTWTRRGAFFGAVLSPLFYCTIPYVDPVASSKIESAPESAAAPTMSDPYAGRQREGES